jgi:hypothetical protein
MNTDQTGDQGEVAIGGQPNPKDEHLIMDLGTKLHAV